MARYWWVNQNQTFEHEYAGGYLWSPKKNANGARNQFYDFMTEVRPGDIVFSFKATKIAAIGIATSSAYTSDKPVIFGQVGSYWSQEGWKVEVDFLEPRRTIQPKNHMALLAPLLPERYSPIRPDGTGNQVYLAEIPAEMGRVLLELVDAPPLELPVVDLSQLKFVPEEQEIFLDDAMTEVQKATMILARRGQGRFRDRVKMIEKSCRVTGVSASQFLIASHIKPWAKSETLEKLDGNNGLFLSPHVDKLFNDGFITFTSKGQLLVAPNLDPDVLSRWAINPLQNYGRFNSEQSFFLEYHNEEIFASKKIAS
jgi:putative restriction endonuclease